ncbi:hypothetical protein ACPA9J_25885 [Pseudomonas aeruginosa]
MALFNRKVKQAPRIPTCRLPINLSAEQGILNTSTGSSTAPTSTGKARTSRCSDLTQSLRAGREERRPGIPGPPGRRQPPQLGLKGPVRAGLQGSQGQRPADHAHRHRRRRLQRHHHDHQGADQHVPVAAHLMDREQAGRVRLPYHRTRRRTSTSATRPRRWRPACNRASCRSWRREAAGSHRAIDLEGVAAGLAHIDEADWKYIRRRDAAASGEPRAASEPEEAGEPAKHHHGPPGTGPWTFPIGPRLPRNLH